MGFDQFYFLISQKVQKSSKLSYIFKFSIKCEVCGYRSSPDFEITFLLSPQIKDLKLNWALRILSALCHCTPQRESRFDQCQK